MVKYMDCGGFVPECLIRDLGVVGSSLIGGILLCIFYQDTLSSATYWFNSGRPVPA